MAKGYPHEIKVIDKELNDEMKIDFAGPGMGYCQVGLDKWCFLEQFAQQAEGFYNMELRKDDLWIVSFPRSGTTWTQELLWMINNDLDYKTSFEVPLDTRFPFIDLLPPHLLDTCKVVYVARNPFDVASSLYHQNRLISICKYTGDFKKFWNYFRDNLVTYGPYWPHVQQAWELRNHPNMLFLFYEDLIKDLPKAVREVSEFLGKPLNEEQVGKLTEHLHIDNFRKAVKAMDLLSINGMVVDGEQGFVRKGKVGQHVEFTDEIKKEAEEWVAEHLSKTDLRFPTI